MFIRSVVRPSLLLSAVIALAFAPPAHALSYTITDLGVIPGGGWSSGYGINQAGVIVGAGSISTGAYHGIAWPSPGQARDLGTWGGQSTSSATAINRLNQIVGVSLGSGFGSYHAVLWWRGLAPRDLGVLPGTGSATAADINDAGQVVGSSFFDYTRAHAFLWQKGVMSDLGTLGGSSSDAYAINNAGQIVGDADTGGGVEHACMWQNGAPTDLGSPTGWTSCFALAISDHGEIAGAGTNAANAIRGFLYVGGTYTEIGPIAGDAISEATDVNSSGYVVGFSTQSYAPSMGTESVRADRRLRLSGPRDASTAIRTEHAWLYANGTQYDLQTLIPAGSGWTLVRADAINDAGLIVGAGWSPNGLQHAFLLTPSP